MRFFSNLFLSSRFYLLVASSVLLLIVSASFPVLLFPAQLMVLVVGLLLLADVWLLWKVNQLINVTRIVPERLSNGDENTIKIVVENLTTQSLSVVVIDEAPIQFQLRNNEYKAVIAAGNSVKIDYMLKPVKRGEYTFGNTNVFIRGIIGLAVRRVSGNNTVTVPVYPSFLQLRKYELLAASHQLTAYGIKQIRKLGHSSEFEKIREYVKGDDYRTVNWKASARKNQLMVNQFRDERSQQVYVLIDKGRLMQMPFDGMSLLDYAINASLVVLSVALNKGDKSGLITFSDKVNTLLPADNRSLQMQKIQELLYRENTLFPDADFEALNSTVGRKINQRSLLLLFTNFEHSESMRRQLPYIKALTKRHLPVVIFFENTALKGLTEQPSTNISLIYEKAIAEKLVYEKRLIVQQLKAAGVQCLLTSPQQLTISAINKYIEIKTRQML